MAAAYQTLAPEQPVPKKRPVKAQGADTFIWSVGGMVATGGAHTEGAKLASKFSMNLIVSECEKTGQVRSVDGSDLPLVDVPLSVANYTAAGVGIRVSTLPAVGGGTPVEQ